jgi:hypothetical protein
MRSDQEKKDILWNQNNRTGHSALNALSNMATLLSNVDNKTWGLGLGKQGKYCTTFPLRLGDGVAAVQLTPGDSKDITIPFPPSVFQGEGDEQRQTLVLNVTDEIFTAFAAVEDAVRDLMRPLFPNISQIWHSALRPAGSYPAQLRCKVNLSGGREVQVFNEADQPIDVPTNWRALEVVPIVTLTAYAQSKTAGLIVDLVALKILGQRQTQQPAWSFLP